MRRWILAVSFLALATPAVAQLDSTTVGSIVSGLKWRNVGPARGGRVTAVTGVMQEARTFYFGSTGGGVWKTVDAGNVWRNVTDGFLDVGSIGALDVSDSDPRVVWVGTGSEALRSNVSVGHGVWTSGDAGATWRFAGLRNAGLIGAVVVHPTDPRTVFVAAVGDPFARSAERGVFRTSDGGATWRHVLFLNDSTGAVDLELHPTNPRIVYATAWRAQRTPWTIISGAGGPRDGGVWKSVDGGDSWTRLGGGLPDALVGKADLAVSPARPDRVYALVEAKPGNGLYRSEDAGATWTRVSDNPGLGTRPFYYTNVDVDPTDADVVYVGTESFYKSTDGGRTFRTMPTPHGDNHDAWIHPKDGRLMIQANDGGANVTQDGGATWSTQYNQPTAEIYQVAVDGQWPYRLYGAQQDNSTLILPSRPLTTGSPDSPMQEWRAGPGCETGPILPHPVNTDTVYASCKGQFSRASLRTGQERQHWVGAQSLYGQRGRDLVFRFQRVSPMDISPWDARTLYYGSQHVHRSRDEGVTWTRISPDLTANEPQYQQHSSGQPITLDVTGEEYYSTLYAIRESPVSRGVIWAGANDGPIHVTRDGGASWTRVTPPDLPPGGRVQNIEPSPHRAGSAYVAVLRYLLGDYQPYLYATEDYGRTWRRLTTGTNGIPADHPTRVVREDPVRPRLLYAGTEFGMWVSFDDGGRWHALQGGLPATPVTDLRVHRGDLVISTQGRAFWILDGIAPLRQAPVALAAARTAHLFAPDTAIRWRYSGSFGGVEGGRGRTPDQPEYPPPGAAIDYWLGAATSSPTTPVTLEIRDAAGRVVRRFSSEGAGERAIPAGPSMRRDSMEIVGTPRLTTRPGLNRFHWDMRWPGPWSADARSGRNGPMVAPGRYTVRLAIGDSSWVRPLVLRADPRVARDGITNATITAQVAHERAARDLVTDAARTADRLRRARERLAKAEGAPAADTLARLRALEGRLLAEPVRYGRPGLQTHITYLYGMTTDADQPVSVDARTRLVELRTALAALVREVDALLGSE